MKRAFETAECEWVRRSIFWELRYEKHENRMKGCDVEHAIDPSILQLHHMLIMTAYISLCKSRRIPDYTNHFLTSLPSYTAVQRWRSDLSCCCCPYLEQSAPTCHVHSLYVCFPRLSSSGVPSHEFYRYCGIACAVTVVTFRDT